MTSISYVTTALNTLLTNIQTEPLTGTCPTGTLSNIDISDCPITVSGTYGNTTTDGYYATYTISFTELLNIINLQITSQLFTPSSTSSTSETVTDNFAFAYVESLTLNGNASGSGEVYTPSYSYDGCILWGPTWAESCWKSPFGKKYCTPYPNGWQCDEKGNIDVPSTYSSDLLIADSINFSLTVNGISGSGALSYTLSNTNPSISGSIVYNTNIYITGEPYGIFYIYGIQILDFTVAFTSFDLTGSSFTLSTAQVQELLADLGTQFQTTIAGIYANYTFQFTVNPTS